MRFSVQSISRLRDLPSAAQWGLWAVGGFLSSLLLLGERAPLAIAAAAACRDGRSRLAVICGAVLGGAVSMDFAAALRHGGILVLVYAVFASFQGTRYARNPAFPALAAAAMTGAVELAYVIQEGVTLGRLSAYAAYLILVGLAAHCLANVSLPEKKPSQGKEEEVAPAATLRRKLELSAAAFRDLYNSLGKNTAPRSPENPAVVFDRAAESTCRSCKQCLQCWDKSYIDTFNALNDATPAMMQRGRSLAEDYPQHFRDRCVKLPQFLTAVNQELNALLLRRQYARLLEAERQRTRGQYAQMSEYLGQAARQMEEVAIPASSTAAPCQVGGAWRPKDGETVCGDTISHFETEEGVLYLLLSDGMGSGEEAQRESVNVTRLLEQFLRAGVRVEAALKTINAALSLKGDDTGSFATIDLLALDRRSRQASLYKYGAAPTYVKRHGTVRRLAGTALPAGLQDLHTVPVPIRFPVEGDTYLLLVSDGVADPGDDEWLQNLLAGWQSGEPQRLVSLIMAESREHGGLQDDCSILCLHLDPIERLV